MRNVDEIRTIVLLEIDKLLDEEGSEHGAVNDQDGLSDMGLDSLGFAVLITRLEDVLGYDPFMAIEQGPPPRTVAELVDFYVVNNRPA